MEANGVAGNGSARAGRGKTGKRYALVTEVAVVTDATLISRVQP